MKGAITIVMLLSIVLSPISCTKIFPGSTNQDNTPPFTSASSQGIAAGVITTGPAVAVASSAIGPNGGSIKVTDAGNPLVGLQVDIPANSLTDTRQIKVSSSPIAKQTFGPEINPVSPLITFDNGGGYSNEWMQVTIPVKVPDGQYAMGFSYDAKKGKLGGLPTVRRDKDSITIATQYFTPLVVSTIDGLLLNESIPSTFKPGVDDWPFTNYGSYIEPGGHCAGQSISALWYFLNKPDGPGVHLYKTYDNNGNEPATPGFWQDDSLGYRFASVIQNDINWDIVSDKISGDLFSGNGDIFGTYDAATMKNIAYSMIQSHGEPQEVGIYSIAGGGHAMVIYAIDKDGLSVADPNYPGDTTRRINFVNGKFLPYNSGANAEDIAKGLGKAYEIIRFVPQDSFIDQAKMQLRWTQLQKKTIGNDKFPVLPIVRTDDAGKSYALADGYVTSNKTIKILVDSKETNFGAYIYRDGKEVTPDARGRMELLPGNNKLGIYELGRVAGKWKYIDFKYINVVYKAPGPTPGPSWKLVDTQIDPTAPANISRAPYGGLTTYALSKNSVTEAYSSRDGNAKMQLALTWEAPPDTLVSGETFSMAIQGNGTVVNRMSNLGAGIEAKFVAGAGLDVVENIPTGWGGSGITPGPADADYAWVNFFGGEKITSDAMSAGGINRSYKFKVTQSSSVSDVYLTLRVGGRGADEFNGTVTFHWRLQS